MENFESSGFATDNLRYERDGFVGTVVLDRPEKLNAFTVEMWHEMADLGAALIAEDEIRALVVRGEGRAFCSGIDVSVFAGGGSDGDGGSLVDPDAIQRLQAGFDWLEDAPFPTIAAMHGYAFGAGLQCGLACDLRVAQEGTQMGILELNFGIVPDLGGTQRLPRVVGVGKAKELIYTSAKIDAAEAHRIGLVERLVSESEFSDHVDALAAELASRAPLAVRGSKELVNRSFDLSISEGLRLEAETQMVCLRSEDTVEAMTAGLEGRTPEFKGS
ncbi:MAG: enoyl-CoA hydratase/isomerase family protein [Acidimicrobiia bacterium]|nr:enoyl-CoA hydratase/isomerase family protein [Acidimicrobiia bacterium]